MPEVSPAEILDRLIARLNDSPHLWVRGWGNGEQGCLLSQFVITHIGVANMRYVFHPREALESAPQGLKEAIMALATVIQKRTKLFPHPIDTFDAACGVVIAFNDRSAQDIDEIISMLRGAWQEVYKPTLTSADQFREAIWILDRIKTSPIVGEHDEYPPLHEPVQEVEIAPPADLDAEFAELLSQELIAA